MVGSSGAVGRVPDQERERQLLVVFVALAARVVRAKHVAPHRVAHLTAHTYVAFSALSVARTSTSTMYIAKAAAGIRRSTSGELRPGQASHNDVV